MSDAYIRRSAAIDLIRRHIGDLQTSREESLIAWVISTLRAMPAADVVPVVRCKACAKHYVVNGRDMCARNAQGSGTHWIGLTATSPDAFCSRGDRKGVNDDT